MTRSRPATTFIIRANTKRPSRVIKRPSMPPILSKAGSTGPSSLEEMGDRAKAILWYQRAARQTTDPAVVTALGWAQWRAGRLEDATTTFLKVLDKKPDDAYSLLGLARVELDTDHADEALKLLQRASAAAPLLNLIPWPRGPSLRASGRPRRRRRGLSPGGHRGLVFRGGTRRSGPALPAQASL